MSGANQRRIPQFFQVVARRGRIFCTRCKLIFQSLLELNHHRLFPCKYRENKPHLSLEFLGENILVEIADRLAFQDLTSFIIALPRLMIAHGTRRIWLRAIIKTETYSHSWIRRNLNHLHLIDHFMIALKQGQRKTSRGKRIKIIKSLKKMVWRKCERRHWPAKDLRKLIWRLKCKENTCCVK